MARVAVRSLTEQDQVAGAPWVDVHPWQGSPVEGESLGELRRQEGRCRHGRYQGPTGMHALMGACGVDSVDGMRAGNEGRNRV